VLRPLREYFPPAAHPDLLAGLEEPDDAAVMKTDGVRAIVFTVDFFTPIVDTPYEFGAIAAANAVSDVYAMGGEPALALNLLACPEELPVPMTREILRGGSEKIREAGAVLAGGHSIRDRELKYGMAVIGFVDPGAVLRKNAARPGDRLFLTKPVGSGAVTTALQRQKAEPRHVREAVGWMMRLNKPILAWIGPAGIRAATDVTGFGLIGHASEMAAQSSVRLRMKYSTLPFFDGALEYARMGMISGGTWKNKEHFEPRVEVVGSLAPEELLLLFDAQTSGGLLFCVPEARAGEFHRLTWPEKEALWEIGRVEEGEGIVVEGG
jgi:selenide,water dikinase